MAGMDMKSVFTLNCQNSCDTVRYRTPVYNMNFRERFVASADSEIPRAGVTLTSDLRWNEHIISTCILLYQQN